MGWRWSVGTKGVNRVTVYERRRGTSIYVEWFDDLGRHRRSFTSLLGHPITDRELAQEAARRMSVAQEKKRNQQAAEALGVSTSHTLHQLLHRRHLDLQATWSEKYRKSRELRRDFWLHELGGAVKLEAVTAARVESIAREAQGEKSDRWRQDVLRYIVDSFAYARRKLKWISERHDLSNVDIPKARGKSRAYTLAEARKLVPALAEVHPVAGWIGTIASQTGRRLSAIRKLRKQDIRTEDGYTVVTFPGGTDKARNSGEAVVFGLAAREDWTVPREETCNDWMHEAEKLAGVEHKQGRAWHGFKRLYATLATDLPGADKQAGTLKSTLDGHYRQDVLAPKVEVAARVSKLLTTKDPK